LHFARSRTICLLLSLGAAFAVLAWSAQYGRPAAPTAVVRAPETPGLVTLRGSETTCVTYTWGGAMHPTVTLSSCAARDAGRVRLRQLP
jgi:hypothetical protein